jgi:hypothetical protein
MMYEKQSAHMLPRTLDDVVDLLIGDLRADERQTLSNLSEMEFNCLYASVAKTIINEFKLWDGNEDLTLACVQASDDVGTSSDPAMTILQKVRQALQADPGIVIIT